MEFRQKTRRHGGWGRGSSRELIVKVISVVPEELYSAIFCISVEVGVGGVAPAKWAEGHTDSQFCLTFCFSKQNAKAIWSFYHQMSLQIVLITIPGFVINYTLILWYLQSVNKLSLKTVPWLLFSAVLISSDPMLTSASIRDLGRYPFLFFFSFPTLKIYFVSNSSSH